jgi:alkylation response protein AidB-like acyl-CoA dehydrogenase
MCNYPAECQDEFFGGGRYIIQGGGTMPPGKAVPVEGGFKVSGRWKWATCITQADWCQVIATVETESGPKPGTFMIPVEQVNVIDTWETDGMRATGTHDIAFEDVFVPEHRCNLDIRRDGTGRGAELYDNPIYSVPLSPLLAFTTAVPTIGCARAAVDMYRERISEHTKRGTDAAQRDKQASQIRLARADVMVRTADILVRQTLKQNLVGTTLRGDAQIPFRSALRAQISYVAELCRQAVLLVCEATGTSIHYLDNPMQRHLRDVMVMTSHIIFDPDVTFEQHGRGMLGLPPTSVIL